MALLKLHPLLNYHDLVSTPKFPSVSFSDLASDYDLVNNDTEFKLSLDVPGIKQSDLEVTVDNGVVRVVGVRRRLAEDGRTEKKLRFVKSFKADPQTVDLDELNANLADGVLVISAPKKAKPQPKTITVTANPTVEAKKVLESEGAKDKEITVETVETVDADK